MIRRENQRTLEISLLQHHFILPSILFSNILRLCSPNVRDQISHTTGKITVLYTLILSPHCSILVYYCSRNVLQLLPSSKLSYPQPNLRDSSLTWHLAGLGVKVVLYRNHKICLVYFIQASNRRKKTSHITKAVRQMVDTHFEVNTIFVKNVYFSLIFPSSKCYALL
jgi:hypothetical protein